MSNELIEKLKRNEVLTPLEVKCVLDYIVSSVSLGYRIDRQNFKDYYTKQKEINTSDYTLCVETSSKIAELCKIFNIYYNIHTLKELGIPDLDHYFGIITFNTKEPLSFIIDLTYIQFLESTYPIYRDNKTVNITSPSTFIKEENKKSLIFDGYITCTQENLKDYIGSFIESIMGKNFNEDIVNQAFDKIKPITVISKVEDFTQLINQKHQESNHK